MLYKYRITDTHHIDHIPLYRCRASGFVCGEKRVLAARVHVTY